MLPSSFSAYYYSSPTNQAQALSTSTVSAFPFSAYKLYTALKDNNAEQIQQWGEQLQAKLPTLSRIQLDELVKLLAAKNKNGKPGLMAALKNNNEDAIRAWGKVLQSIAPRLSANGRCQLIKLLAAEDDNERAGLCDVLNNGQVIGIKALGDVLKEIVQELPDAHHCQLVEVLAAKNDDGTPGLSLALGYGYTDAIVAWGKVVEDIAPKLSVDARGQLVNLFADKYNHNAALELLDALKYGYTESIEAWGKVLHVIVPTLSAGGLDQLFNLLSVKNKEGTQRLLVPLLLSEDKRPIDAYRKLLENTFKQLAREQRYIIFDILDLIKIDTLKNKGDVCKNFNELINTWQEEFYMQMNKSEENDAPELEARHILGLKDSDVGPNSVDMIFNLGRDHLRGENGASRDEQKAFGLLQLAHKAGHQHAALTLADFYFRQGGTCIPLGKQWNQIALQASGDNTALAKMHLSIGAMYMNKNQPQINSATSEARNELLVISQKDLEMAVFHFTQALAECPQRATFMLGEAHLNLFKNYRMDASLIAAKKYYNQAIDCKVDPNKDLKDQALLQLESVKESG